MPNINKLAQGLLALTIKNPNEKLLNSMANMVKNKSGTFVPHVEKYNTIPPFEAYDIHPRGSGLLIKDIHPNKESLAHNLVPDKVGGASILQGVDAPNHLMLQYLQHFPTLTQMAKGINPVNTTMGKWSSDAVNKLGGLLSDLKISPNDSHDFPVVGKLDELVNQRGFDPNDIKGILQYIANNNVHLLNYQKGANIFKGADLQGTVTYPPKGLESGKELRQWLNDTLTPAGKLNVGKGNERDLVLQYLFKNKGSIDPELF
jgi:hypothetical protein